MEDQKILSDDLPSDPSSETLVKDEALAKDEELEKYKKEAEENMAGWKRAMADYQNLKKDTERERVMAVRIGAQSVIFGFLPVLDHFDEAVAHVPKDDEEEGWVKGVILIKKEIEDLLKQFGVEAMGCIGENFDPSRHEALGEEETDGAEPGKIIKEMQKGYTQNGEVLRPAKVIISK